MIPRWKTTDDLPGIGGVPVSIVRESRSDSHLLVFNLRRRWVSTYTSNNNLDRIYWGIFQNFRGNTSQENELRSDWSRTLWGIWKSENPCTVEPRLGLMKTSRQSRVRIIGNMNIDDNAQTPELRTELKSPDINRKVWIIEVRMNCPSTNTKNVL